MIVVLVNESRLFGPKKPSIECWSCALGVVFVTNFGDLNFLLNFRQIFIQFWIEEIGEFLSDKNVTNSGDNNSFQFWGVFLSQISANIFVNH